MSSVPELPTDSLMTPRVRTADASPSKWAGKPRSRINTFDSCPPLRTIAERLKEREVSNAQQTSPSSMNSSVFSLPPPRVNKKCRKQDRSVSFEDQLDKEDGLEEKNWRLNEESAGEEEIILQTCIGRNGCIIEFHEI